MKEIADLHHAHDDEYIQGIIAKLQGDLLTVLEAYAEDMISAELFYHMLSYLTTALYECSATDEEALKVLRLGMDDGIHKHFMKEQ